MRKSSVSELTSRFNSLGIDRSKLPENLNEYFGLFASERQNVQRGVEFIRTSPLIGPRVPVHGLLLDIESGRIEWLVNGYEALSSAPSTTHSHSIHALENPAIGFATLTPFAMGEWKLPQEPIGSVSGNISAAPKESGPRDNPSRPMPPLIPKPGPPPIPHRSDFGGGTNFRK